MYMHCSHIHTVPQPHTYSTILQPHTYTHTHTVLHCNHMHTVLYCSHIHIHIHIQYCTATTCIQYYIAATYIYTYTYSTALQPHAYSTILQPHTYTHTVLHCNHIHTYSTALQPHTYTVLHCNHIHTQYCNLQNAVHLAIGLSRYSQFLASCFEKHFFSLITEHLDEHYPLSPAQWGFQKGKSTITALLSATHDWLSQLDQNKDIHVCCVFFDFQKAFDTVPHKSLMERLSQLDLHPLILRWIHSYLRSREQYVVVNGAASQSIPVISGVPQGSVLGSLLFLVYIDSISLLQLSEGSKLSLYADDMLLYKTISSDADYISLQQDIDLIHGWSTANLMTFNVSKCKCMVISRKRNVNTPSLTLNSSHLEVVECYKYLGLLLSSDLSWSSHIEAMCAKVRRLLGLLYRQFPPTQTHM